MNAQPIELVVFDMAGTTVRDDDAVNICLRQALAAESVQVTRDDVNEVMGIAKPLAIRHLLSNGGDAGPDSVRDATVEKVHADFLRRMIFHYQTSGTVEPMPHAVETFSALKEAGIAVALDTGFSRIIVDAILQRLGWEDSPLIDATVASDEVARGRPHADLVDKAMFLTGVRTAAAVAKVGDTPADLAEGTAAGCALIVGVTNGSHTAGQLRACPHTHLIGSLAELPDLVLRHAPRHSQ